MIYPTWDICDSVDNSGENQRLGVSSVDNWSGYPNWRLGVRRPYLRVLEPATTTSSVHPATGANARAVAEYVVTTALLALRGSGKPAVRTPQIRRRRASACLACRGNLGPGQPYSAIGSR